MNGNLVTVSSIVIDHRPANAASRTRRTLMGTGEPAWLTMSIQAAGG
jgi:hypothetical protein